MKRSLLVLCLLYLTALICNCIFSNQNVIPSSKYAAIYVEITEGGTIVNGYYPYPPYPGGPMGYMKPFLYRKSDYPVGEFPYPMNDSMKILLGTLNIKGSASVNIVSSLTMTEIYNFPYTIEPGITINGVTSNGTIELSYGNESINLPPGSTWKSPILATWNETDTVKYPPPDIYTGIDNGTNYTYTVQYNRIMTVENKGMFDK